MSVLNLLKCGVLAAGFGLAMTQGALALDGGDAAKGEALFKKCSACHDIGPEAANKVGPALTSVVGRVAGTYEGYKYGKSIVQAGKNGLIWNDDELFAYLVNPKKYLRAKLEDKKAKSKMSFRLKKEDERKDIIAYLNTFASDTGGSEESASEESSTSTD